MKVYKVELMIIDHDEVGEDIKSVIEDQKYPNYCIYPEVMDIKCREIGEWTDDHPLNDSETSLEFFKQLFK
jgi:hypothetical protein